MQTRRFNGPALVVTLFVVAAASVVRADVPRVISYQGRLLGQGNDPVDLEVTFYDSAAGSTVLFSENHSGVPLHDGIFSIGIGSQTPGGVPDSALEAPAVWLGLRVGTGQELSPRTRIGMVPFAGKAVASEQLTRPGTMDPAVTVSDSGSVAIGTDTPMPGSALHVVHPDSIAVIGECLGEGTRGYLGHESAGVFGRADLPNGFGGYFQGRGYFSGNVGIGVDSPQAKLHVGGEPDVDGIMFPDGSLQKTAATGSGDDLWSASGSDIFYDTGNVGIGTSSPTDRLHVIGDSFVDGNVRLGTGATTTIDLQATEDGDEGALVELSQDAGTPTIVLDADYRADMGGNFGAVVELKSYDGHTGVSLRAESTGGGLVQLNDSGGDSRATLGVYGSTGGYLVLKDAGNQEGVRVYADSAYGTHVGGAIALRDGADDKLGLFANFEETGFSRVVSDVIEIKGGADLSEQFDVAPGDAAPKPGMVVAIDAKNPGKLVVANRPYDRKVAGVISGAGGVQPGMLMGQSGTVADGKHPVALAGRVWTLCDASRGTIEPGDLLTTSDTLGHAMKVTNHARGQGAIIGKAMTGLDQGTGLVLVLVSLQ